MEIEESNYNVGDTIPSKGDPRIGRIAVLYKKHRIKYQIRSKQWIWGYDRKGNYILKHGYRLYRTDIRDKYGIHADPEDFYVLTREGSIDRELTLKYSN